MKVQISEIDLYGGFTLEQKKTVDESLRFWVDGQSSRDANIPAESQKKSQQDSQEDRLVLSPEVLSKRRQEPPKAEEAGESGELSLELSAKDREVIALLERFLSKLTGKKVKILVPEKMIFKRSKPLSLELPDGKSVRIPNERQGWGLDYSYQETYSEKETMVFSSQGRVQTEDGRTIDFQLFLEMDREIFSSQSLRIQAGDALIDPLVINYEMGSPKLSEEKIDFDLDGDGEKNRISFLEKGSGFLVLDKDENGIVNDGTELFGPTTGDGFRELATQDSDRNGWIDENDPIFNQLKIWIKDSNSREQLIAIGKVGIGAIYLGNVDTIFSLNAQNNSQLGKVQKTGIFLKEDGKAGTIQHIDLAI